MIKISIKKYMIIDLLMMFILGAIVEILALYIVPRSIPNGVPTFCVSVLIIIVAESRWGYKGLILVPFYALYIWGAGRLVGYFKGNYDVTMFLKNLIGFMGCSVVLLFRKKGKVMFSDWAKTVGICLLALIVVITLQSVVYSAIERMNLFESLMYHLIQAAMGIAITIIGILVLKSQKVTRDVYQTLLERDKEREYERKYYSQYVNNIVIKPNEGSINEKTKENDTLSVTDEETQKK